MDKVGGLDVLHVEQSTNTTLGPWLLHSHNSSPWQYTLNGATGGQEKMSAENQHWQLMA